MNGDSFMEERMKSLLCFGVLIWQFGWSIQVGILWRIPRYHTENPIANPTIYIGIPALPEGSA